MDGALIAYHNTQKVFGFEYVKISEMSDRIFGNHFFFDLIFKYSLILTEKIFDVLTEDFWNHNVLKIGIYANQPKFCIDILVEFFENDDVYIDAFEQRDVDPIDFYNDINIKPKVMKYECNIFH